MIQRALGQAAKQGAELFIVMAVRNALFILTALFLSPGVFQREAREARARPEESL
jgi:hypothetical protein